jgi:DNA polymerase III delta prime subunit
MFSQKYKPTTQKLLFHKDVVNHIRKWIQTIEYKYETIKDVKQILFLNGPVGCGKSVTIECLFKGYNLVNIDSDNLRNNDRVNETLQQVIDFSSITLANIDKWNHKNKKDKNNIVFIDNIELCERGIESFVNLIYTRNINVPIILICNTTKYKDIFSSYKNCTFIDFKHPSLLEMSKLIIDINKEERLNLEKDMIKQIIEKSQNDIRQIIFILEQWNISKGSKVLFSKFIDTIDFKYTDDDLSKKMDYIFKSRGQFDFNKVYNKFLCEPHIVSNTIFQNYVNITLDSTSRVSEISETNKFSNKDDLNILDNMVKVMDNISYSNIIHNEIYEHQQWQLYDEYINSSCIIPTYYLQKNNEIIFKELDMNYRINFNSFKDISYNFINSYNEVKNICKKNTHYSKFDINETNNNANSIFYPLNCFYIVNILLDNMKILNIYFDKNKKGKNTTKKEKLELYNNMNDIEVINALDKIFQIIYDYKLFEIDNLDKLKKDGDEIIKKNFQKINLRVLKRLLNIFTFDDNNKIFKSNIETSLQYKILEHLINNSNYNKVTNVNTVDEMTIDLDKIWGF